MHEKAAENSTVNTEDMHNARLENSVPCLGCSQEWPLVQGSRYWVDYIPEQSLHQVCEAKKNTVQSKGRGVEKMSQHEASGIAHAALGDRGVKVGGSVPPPTQGLQSTGWQKNQAIG